MTVGKITSTLENEIIELLGGSIYKFKFNPKTKILGFEYENSDITLERLLNLSKLLKTEEIHLSFEVEVYDYCECCSDTSKHFIFEARNVMFEDK